MGNFRNLGDMHCSNPLRELVEACRVHLYLLSSLGLSLLVSKLTQGDPLMVTSVSPNSLAGVFGGDVLLAFKFSAPTKSNVNVFYY